MQRSPTRRYLLTSISLLIQVTTASADLPTVRFDQLQPFGGTAGTEIEVEIQGSDIEGVDRIIFDHPGLTAKPIDEKERSFTVQIAEDLPPGTYDAYLAGRFGVSNPRLFAVTTGLIDVADNGENHTIDTAQAIAVNSAINGQCDGNADDFYRIVLQAKQRVTIDCVAQRLDSSLDAVMVLTTSGGRLLAASSDYYGKDPFIDFLAPADGDYVVSLHDLSYRGGQPYRVVVTDQPHVENVFPAVVQVGRQNDLTAIGRNLLNIGGKESELKIAGLPLDIVKFSWEPSAELMDKGDYAFRDHPTHHSVLPTAATCTLTGQQVQVPGVDALWSSPPVLVTADPVAIDTEPNNSQDNAQQVTLPLVVGGRFDELRDADWFGFTPSVKGPYTFNVYCERIAGRADPYLVIVDDKGNRMTELDDFGHRVNAFDGHLRDPSQEVNLEQDRTYKMLVQDRYGRGGARYHYVLEVRQSEPDFFPAVIHRSNQNPAGTTLFKGTATYLDVVIHHRGNTRSDVTITGEGLPAGLHVAPTAITNDTRGTLVMWADADAPDFTGPIQLVATAEVEGRVIRRAVRPYSRVWNNSGTSQVTRSLMVAIREQGPFDLRIEPAEIDVQAGSKAELTVHLTRLWPDMQGKVSIQPQSFPGSFQMSNFDISSDANSAPLEIQVQPNTRPGRYTLTLQGQSQVPFSKDLAATDRPATLVATPSRPVTIRVVPKE